MNAKKTKVPTHTHTNTHQPMRQAFMYENTQTNQITSTTIFYNEPSKILLKHGIIWTNKWDFTNVAYGIGTHACVCMFMYIVYTVQYACVSRAPSWLCIYSVFAIVEYKSNIRFQQTHYDYCYGGTILRSCCIKLL